MNMLQGKKPKAVKKLARVPDYVSPSQLTIVGFETPFQQALSSQNRWVKLSQLLPWDSIVAQYNKSFKSAEGRQPINGRIVIGAVVIKHMLNLSDRETVQQIRENVFMQYFLGYSSFTNEAPFDASLFVDIRHRLSLEVLNSINEVVMAHHFDNEQHKQSNSNAVKEPEPLAQPAASAIDKAPPAPQVPPPPPVTHKGKLLMDATVAPQNITFPTDLKLLDAAREKSEELIDKLYRKELHGKVKPRTYRSIARKEFLDTAKKKAKTAKQIYKANGRQLRFLKRNLAHIERLLQGYNHFPLTHKEQKYLMVLNTVYEQQHHMHSTRTNRIDDRIVNIHQPHVRPIKRGKDGKKVEFGSKLQVSLSDGFALIDKLSWDNFNEGGCLQTSVEQYRQRFGYYPQAVLADKIYCTRENRKTLKELGIELRAKPLGRPAATALQNQISPGERNPIEGKFGQAKAGYNMECIKAKLKTTSESWIASIILVLNLVNLTRLALYCLNSILHWLQRIWQGSMLRQAAILAA
jgi:IS5 family transposase